MNNTKKNRIGKTVVGISLTLSIAFSGNMFVAPQSAHAAVASSSTADNIIATGQKFLGVPYQFGAKTGNTSSFDCSSFIQYVFKQNGINLPRSSRQQSSVGVAVSKDQLQPGDLIFSDTNRDGTINHVSIYMGNGKLLHTYRVGIGVTISNFAGSTWDKTFVSARRVLPSNGQALTAPQTNSSQPQQKPATQKPTKSSPQPGAAPQSAVVNPVNSVTEPQTDVTNRQSDIEASQPSVHKKYQKNNKHNHNPHSEKTGHSESEDQQGEH